MTRSLVHEAEYTHPVEKVWRALTEPEQMGLWIMNFSNEEGEMKKDAQLRTASRARRDRAQDRAMSHETTREMSA